MNIISVLKSRMDEAYMGENKNTFKILARKSKGKKRATW
jgi:hypothetical protein